MTIALLAYKQERFIEEAVESVLSQAHQPFEIILSDDCSPDATFELIKKAAQKYSGAAEIRVRQNPENLGIAAHFNQVMKESRGDFVLVCAGDDISLPNRAQLTASYFGRNSRLTALSLRQHQINELGKITKEAGRVSSKSLAPVTVQEYLSGRARHPSGASRAYRKDVFDLFGPLAAQCPTEDTPMLLRAMLLGEVCEFPEVGILYRRHAGNLSSQASISAMDTKEIYRQQRVDLQRALELGLLDQGTLHLYERLLEQYWARRRLNTSVHEQQVWSALSRVLSESHLAFGERVSIAARLVLRRVRSALAI